MKRFVALVSILVFVIVAVSFAVTRLPSNRPYNEDENRLLGYARQSERVKYTVFIDKKCQVSKDGSYYRLTGMDLEKGITFNVLISNFKLIHIHAWVNGSDEWIEINNQTELVCPK